MVATVFMHFWTVLERKSEVRLISEFWYLTLWQIQKLSNLGKTFSVSGMI